MNLKKLQSFDVILLCHYGVVILRFLREVFLKALENIWMKND